MKTSTFVTVSLLSLASTVFSAPTPAASNILGSITSPSAGNNNIFAGNGNKNGNANGNDNSAGNNNGNHNVAGSGNRAGNGNTVTFPSILDDRDLGSSLGGITNTIGSVTNPTAGSGNKFLGNGNGNGNGNSAGNGNGNGNVAGSNNEAGNGNTVNVSPSVSPSIALPDVTLPDISL